MTTMTRQDIQAAILDVLGGIAPEADLSALDPDLNLREQLDLDSMDALNVLIGIDAALGVDIPEIAYARLATLNDCIDYVMKAKGLA